ncbi:MAG: alpha/beta hydrolase family protein [Gaiellaceae bacterium]
MPVRLAAAAVLAVTLVGCGGGDSASRVAELGAYDDTKPLHVQEQSRSQGSVDITYQSPRGGDVPASLVLPPGAEGGTKRYPVVLFIHPYFASRGLFVREAFDLADKGVASFLVDATISRQGRGRPDLSDPVYAADSFHAFVRQDLVDLRRGLDYLATRKEIDLERVAVVGQEYGAVPAGALAAVDDRIDALVLATVPAEPSRYWAKELVPQETLDSFAETLRDFDTIRLLDAIKADVLIQNPRRDDDFPAKEYERLAEKADDADVRWYEYGHHMGPDADADRAEWLRQKLAAG